MPDLPSKRSDRGALRGRVVGILLPSPVSVAHAIAVLIVGFAVEAATEAYQFLQRGNLVQGPIAYYTTLATTIFGFYLMFLGMREWHTFHPKEVPAPPAPGHRRWPWFGIGLWLGGTAATAVLGVALGGLGSGSSPFWIVWPIGGVVVLALGGFFFGLRKEARLLGSSNANAVGWFAFTWALAVGTVAGLVVGELAVRLLTEFVTNWVALVASVGPIVVAMSPLCVPYVLMILVFSPALRRREMAVVIPIPAERLELKTKSLEFKKFFRDIQAVLEEWKFSIEETKEGTRIEVHAIALVRHK
jgi:hypothetical protein